MTRISAENLPLQRIFHWERERADRVFLTQPQAGTVREYTWAQAVNEARRMAAFLRAQGFPAGSSIAIMSRNCAHWLMADFAIWMAGHVSVPLYPTLTATSVRQVLEHSESRAIFAGKLDAWGDMLRGVPEGVLRISFPSSPPNAFSSWDDIVAHTGALSDPLLRGGGELATIVYTSGTTGTPKGVLHSFSNLAWSADNMIQHMGVCSEDRMLSYLPLSHVAERQVLQMIAVRTGLHVFFCESLDTFMNDLRRARPTLFISVPRLWVKFQRGVSAKLADARLRRLLAIPVLGTIVRKRLLRELGLDHVRIAGSGAAPIPESTMRWYRDLGLELLEGYGMTELFGLSHMCRSGQVRVGYVGQPLDGVDCKLSEAGEVLVRSPANTQGYFRDPERTSELFTEDGYIHTGDRGSIDGMNRLKITGRVKELFKTSKGKYVAPAPIENMLAAHSCVEACCVTGANQHQPCALLVLSPETMAGHNRPGHRDALQQSLAEHLVAVNASLDPHERLHFVTIVADEWNVENDFLTPTLKVKRNVIDATYGPYLDDWYARGETVIWQDST
jgi:long-chain acyl-CoA synthetase